MADAILCKQDQVLVRQLASDREFLRLWLAQLYVLRKRSPHERSIDTEQLIGSRLGRVIGQHAGVLVLEEQRVQTLFAHDLPNSRTEIHHGRNAQNAVPDNLQSDGRHGKRLKLNRHGFAVLKNWNRTNPGIVDEPSKQGFRNLRSSLVYLVLAFLNVLSQHLADQRLVRLNVKQVRQRVLDDRTRRNILERLDTLINQGCDLIMREFGADELAERPAAAQPVQRKSAPCELLHCLRHRHDRMPA